MERFILSAEGSHEAALQEALTWLVQRARTDGCEAAVIMPSVEAIKNLEPVIGRQIAGFARQNRYFRIGPVTVRVFTLKTKPHSFPGPVLVPWGQTKQVLEVEKLRPSVVIATEWIEDELADWKRTYAPTDLRTGRAEQAEQASEPVRGAVKSLSSSYGDDVLNPYDRARAIDAFKALRICGVPVDTTLVRGLAVRSGWAPQAADRLAVLAGKVAAGRPVRGGSSMTKTRAKQLVAGFTADPD